jgi:uncharacterized RDD family membrane protein YckC
MTNIRTEPNLGRRILTGLIDYTVIYGLAIVLVVTLGEPNAEGTYELTGVPAMIPIVFWLFMTVGLEVWFGGTLGNTVVGLKAIPRSGQNRNLTFGQSFKRHFLDPVDMCFFGLAGIITIKNTEQNQRVGDLWAKTIVVRIKDLAESTLIERKAHSS